MFAVELIISFSSIRIITPSPSTICITQLGLSGLARTHTLKLIKIELVVVGWTMLQPGLNRIY